VDEDFDFDDGGGSPEDYGMTQVDFDAATEAGRDVFSDNLGGDDAEGFSSFAFDRTPQQTYTMGRGASVTNPFPESIFSRLFGAENVDYTNILGSQGVAGINQLRFDQAMNPSQFKMGDFYVGQPTFEEGIVKEVPRGGIIGAIPGLSTIANVLGRNRGLPEGSDAFRKAVEESKKSVFQPLTDIINSITSGIGSLTDRFRSEEGGDRDTLTDRPIQPRGVELGDMDTSAAFIPGSRVMVDNLAPPVTTFDTMITDDGANLNTGIANVAPNKANEANMQVADALQLIQPGTLSDSIGVRNFVAQTLNPELKAFIDRQPSIDQRMRELQNQREQIQREEQFKADVLKSIQNRNLQNRNVDRLATINQDYFNRIRNQEPFVDSGDFIVVD
tara:strand:+ start:690 stop:1853 length:1164 start_codon:yes stop_codon:yes gene_type:complete